MTDESPVKVSAHFSNEAVPNPRGAQFKDAAGTVRIETASGKRFYMDCSADQGHGVNAVYMARNGRITVDELAGELVAVVREAEHSALPTTRYGMPIETERLAITPADAVAPSAAVLSALIAGVDYPTGKDGRLAMEVLIAAHLSHEKGGAVGSAHRTRSAPHAQIADRLRRTSMKAAAEHRVAIIGTGAMAREHIKAFRDVPGVTVCGIYGRTRHKAEALATSSASASSRNWIEELHRTAQPDLVQVSVYETGIRSVSIRLSPSPGAS